MQQITALVMVGAVRTASDAVRWVSEARRAATNDLLVQLTNQPSIGRVLLATPELTGLVVPAGTEHLQTPVEAPHMGQFLAELVAQEKIERLLYFGGGSAPLLSDEQLSEICQWLMAADEGVITNNRYATDWAGVVPARRIINHIDRLPRDNMLGWVLSDEGGMPARALRPAASTRLDIDTPLELVVLQSHSETKAHLRACLEPLPLLREPFGKILRLLRTPATRWIVSGRLAPGPWQRLNQVTQCWFRVLSEERGMVSSGRQARGEAYSFLAEHLEAVGSERFWETLANQADGLLIDTRVMLAHHNSWPPETDRFASDLLQPAAISDPWLHKFTKDAVASGIPLILSGHSLMSGALYAICDLLEGDGKI